MTAYAPSPYEAQNVSEVGAQQLPPEERDKLQEIHELINILLREMPVTAQVQSAVMPAYVNCQLLGQATDHLASLEGQLTSAYGPAPSQDFGLAPFQVIVFEEIDKAPPAFVDDLALAIDCGSISTPGRVFPLHNSFVIRISDLSRKKADQLVGRTIGFFLDGEPGLEMSRRQAVALEEVDNRIGPRLVSRIDEIVVFERLSQQNIITLLERKLAEIERYLAEACIGFIIAPDAKTFLLKEGLDDLHHVARQITRVVRNYLEFPLADLMLSNRLIPGTTVTVKHEETRSFLNFEIMMPGIAPFASQRQLDSLA